MNEIRFELDIQYPHDRALNRIWLGMLIGGIAFGLPRFILWCIYDVVLQRPFAFDAEIFFKAASAFELRKIPWHPGHIAVVLLAAAAIFCWWRLVIWAIRNQMD